MDSNKSSSAQKWTPKSSVAHLASIVTSSTNFSEDDIYETMDKAGIPFSIADLAYKFTQVAWGRVFLDGMGIEFSPDYFCFDGRGNVLEHGQLHQQPFFIAAMDVAKKYAQHKSFGLFAVMSADVQVVNNALNNGSSPEDLVLMPVGLFLEEPTSNGMKKAQELMSKKIDSRYQNQSSNRSKPASKKPGWKFW